MKKKILITGSSGFIGNIFLNDALNKGYFIVDVLREKNKKKIEKIVEKPKKFISNNAITGLYFFDRNVSNYSSKLKKSSRGELEITDLIKEYKKRNKLKYELIGRGAIWSDAGKIEDLSNVTNYVKSVEKVQGIKIACLEEISLLKKWINKSKIRENIKFYGNCEYSSYLKSIIN